MRVRPAQTLRIGIMDYFMIPSRPFTHYDNTGCVLLYGLLITNTAASIVPDLLTKAQRKLA